jgi:hypothetical protein
MDFCGGHGHWPLLIRPGAGEAFRAGEAVAVGSVDGRSSGEHLDPEQSLIAARDRLRARRLGDLWSWPSPIYQLIGSAPTSLATTDGWITDLMPA